MTTFLSSVASAFAPATAATALAFALAFVLATCFAEASEVGTAATAFLDLASQLKCAETLVDLLTASVAKTHESDQAS
jgi:hypothetical protein